MKAVCTKHGMAYDVAQGCLYCVPVAVAPVTAPPKRSRLGNVIAADDIACRCLDLHWITYGESKRQEPVVLQSGQYYLLRVEPEENPVWAFFDHAINVGLSAVDPTPVASYWSQGDAVYDLSPRVVLGVSWFTAHNIAYFHNVTILSFDRYLLARVAEAMCTQIGVTP